MNSSMQINPHFGNNPLLYFLGLKGLAVATIISTGASVYCIVYKSPKSLSRNFKALLLYHVAIAQIANIFIIFFSTPLVYLPYVAAELAGFSSDLNVSPILQISLIVNLLICEATAVVPFFYYRMNAILPKSHVLNNKFLRGLLYFGVYGVIDIILPVPLFYTALTYENQTRLKTELLQEYLVYYEDFMTDKVVVVRFGNDNPYATAIVVLILLGSVLAIALIVFCSATIVYYIRKKMVNASERNKQQQRALFAALVSMSLVIYAGLGVLVPAIAYLLVTNSWRADLMHCIIFLGMGLFPAAMVVYMLNYKPYRNACLGIVIRKFKKEMSVVIKPSMVRSRSIASPTSPMSPTYIRPDYST